MQIRGAVQGVGFRPFVYRLATELGLPGWVVNSSAGVVIEVEGDGDALDRFLLRVGRECPPRAIVQGIESVFLDAVGFTAFEIRASVGGEKTALVLPDIATCPDCLREMRDPGNRRFRYPFTNCTNCGPRFTIIQALPYDRPNTTMAGFPMCEACGRSITIRGTGASTRSRTRARRAARISSCGMPMVRAWRFATRRCARPGSESCGGAIVAVKGLGGFHLVVDARNDPAVQRLRQAKAREEKPFALMFPSLDAVRAACEVTEREPMLLASPEAPIVLLRRAGGGRAGGQAVAPSGGAGQPVPGRDAAGHAAAPPAAGRSRVPVVATSGNRSDEPICTDEREAVERLRGLADVFLVHDRPIARHVDDSIVRFAAGRELVLRRARGYAPLPVSVKAGRSRRTPAGGASWPSART